jgi:hypothetical protein
LFPKERAAGCLLPAGPSVLHVEAAIDSVAAMNTDGDLELHRQLLYFG